MPVIVGLIVVFGGIAIWRLRRDDMDGWGWLAGFVAGAALLTWGILTLLNISCTSLGESYQEETRFDWMTGCMLPLDDGREVQIDEESIAFVVREFMEDE